MEVRQKRFRGKIGWVLLLLLLIPLIFYAGGNASAATVEGPAYAMHPVKLNQAVDVPGTTDLAYTTDNLVGRIYVDGVNLEGAPIQGAYLEIKVNSEYVDRFFVGPASIIKEATLTKDDANKVWTYRVNLVDLYSSVKGSFTYEVSMKDRITPEGYVLEPLVELKTSTGEIIASNQDIDLVTKVQLPQLRKFIVTNDNSTYGTDGRVVYGGDASADNSYIETPTDVSFLYSLSTAFKESRNHVIIDGKNVWQSYGTGLARTRKLESIKITDILPTYTDRNNATRTAAFDPNKNPDWTLSADGKSVSYTVNWDQTNAKGAEYNLTYDPVKLVLSFPDAKIVPNQSYPQGITGDITNEADAALTPVNHMEGEPIHVVGGSQTSETDTLKFKLDALAVKPGILNKNSNDGFKITLDPGSMHLRQSTYVLTITNINSFPMKNIVIRDLPADPRYYIKYISGGIHTDHIEAIYGITAEGQKEAIDFQAGVGSLPTTYIDKTTHDAVLANAAAYESGTLPMDQTGVTRRYDSVEIDLKDGYELSPGGVFQYYVALGFRDPYHLTFNETDAAQNELRNRATASAELTIDGVDYPLETEHSSLARLIPMVQETAISKVTAGQEGTSIGSQVTFEENVSWSGLAKATKFTNPTFVDVLPQGLTFTSAYIVDERVRTDPDTTITLVDNYNGSGRQAVIIKFDDFFVQDMPSLRIQFFAKINENAASTWNDNAPELNMNRLYFYAQEWQNLRPEIQYKNTLDDIFDIDLDGNKEEHVFGSQSTFVASLPEDVQGLKYIRRDEGDPWSTSMLYLGYETEFQYKITAQNNDKDPLTGLHIYDRFPYDGDTEYYYLNGAYPSRNSAFSNVITGPVINPEPEKYTIMYRTDRYPVANPPSAVANTDLWKTEEQVPDFGGWESVTAIYIKMNPGHHLDGYSKVEFIVNAKTPEYVRSNPHNRAYANNNFAISYDGTKYGQSNTVSIRLTLDLPVEKQWVGGNPETREPITVELLLNGRPPLAGWPFARELVLDAANEWKGIFEGLPAIGRNGEIYTYSVREKNKIPGYTTEILGDDTTGYVIQNTYEPAKIPITIHKVWEGGENFNEGMRPDVTTILTPYVNDQKIDEGRAIILSRDTTGWSTTIELPNTDVTGNEIEYRLTEPTPPENYVLAKPIESEAVMENGVRTGLALTVTNKFVSPIRAQRFSKFWHGGSLPKPEAKFQVFRHKVGTTWETAEAYMDAVSSSTTPNRPYVSLDVPAYDETGHPYRYVGSEIGGLKDYVSYRDISAGADLAVDLINTYVSPRKEILANKVWKGGEDLNGGVRPDVSLQLMRNGVKYEPGYIIRGRGVPRSIINLTFDGQPTYQVAKVLEDGSWTAELPLGIDPETTRFQITQFKTPDEAVAVGEQSNMLVQSSPIFYNISPEGVPEMLFSVDKVVAGSETITGWGVPGETVNIALDGTNFTAVVDGNRRWSVNVPGGAIKTESDLIATSNGMLSDPFVMINPDLQMDDPEVVSGEQPVNPILLKDPDTVAGWDMADTDFYAQKYHYSVVEVNVPEGYTVSYEENPEGTTTVTNEYGGKFTDIPVHKDWFGGEAPYPSITLELQRRIGEEEFKPVDPDNPGVLLETGDHIHIYKAQPLEDSRGNVYEYRVVETKIGDEEVVNDKALIYTVTYKGSVEEGFTVTNTSDNSGEIEILKKWVDDTNAEETRPGKIALTVTRDDGVQRTEIFDVEQDKNETTYKISGLTRYKLNSTEEHTYAVDELDIPGYTKTIEGNTITNTLSDKKSVTIKKIWEGDIDPTATYTAKFQLLQNGNKMEPEQIIELSGNEANDFTATHVFKELERYDSTGKAYVYTVEEIPEANSKFVSELKTDTPCGCDFLFVNRRGYVDGKGDLVATKVDEGTGAPLQGGTFTLVNANTQAIVLENIVSNAQGLLEVNDLQEGTYLLYETVAPQGYVKNIARYTVVVDHAGKVTINGTEATLVEGVATYKIPNVPEDYALVLQKTDENLKLLPGASFDLRLKGSTEVIGSYTTDDRGLITVEKLTAGTYELVETKAPIGYGIEGTGITEFTISKPLFGTAKIVDLHIQNKRIVPEGRVLLGKVAGESGAPLEGAEFTLIDFKTKEVVLESILSDGEGLLEIENLPEGLYLLYETKAPKGYIKNVAQYTILVDEAGKVTVNGEATEAVEGKPTYEVPNFPEKYDLLVQKTDENLKLLPGAEFDLRLKGETEVLGKYVTDEHGLIAIEKLAPGTYELVETKAPAGYEIEGTGITEFTIERTLFGGTKKVDLHITNKATPVPVGKGDLVAEKIDAVTEAPLKGAEFTLLDFQTQDVVVEKIISNDKGLLEVNGLQEGMYLLYETTAPEGYVKSIARYTVLVDGTGKVTINGMTSALVEGTATYKIPNVPEDYALVVQKTDENLKLLPGAKFDLRLKGSTETIGSYTTDAHGLIILEKLQGGDYELIETEAPKGYHIDGTGITEFTVPKDENARIVDLHITNKATETEKTQIVVNKIWKNVPRGTTVPQTTIFILGSDNRYQEKVLEPGETSVTFIELEKYDEDGNPITYRVVEDAVKGYYATLSGSAAEGYTVTNTLIPTCPPGSNPEDPTPDPDPEDPTPDPDPEDPIPVDPTEPVDPAVPSKPNPGKPAPTDSGEKTPSKPGKNSTIPKTDDPVVFWGIVTGALALALGGILGIKKRLKDEEKDDFTE